MDDKPTVDSFEGYIKKKRYQLPISTEEPIFEELADGKYIVKYWGERASRDKHILGVFEILYGEHKGAKLFLKLESALAKKMTRDYSGLWLSRLSFEGVKSAGALENAILNSENEFIVNVKKHYVSSIPEPDYDKVENLKKKLR